MHYFSCNTHICACEVTCVILGTLIIFTYLVALRQKGRCWVHVLGTGAANVGQTHTKLILHAYCHRYDRRANWITSVDGTSTEEGNTDWESSCDRRIRRDIFIDWTFQLEGIRDAVLYTQPEPIVINTTENAGWANLAICPGGMDCGVKRWGCCILKPFFYINFPKFILLSAM